MSTNLRQKRGTSITGRYRDGGETGGSITPKLQDLEAKAGMLRARLAEIDAQLTTLNDSTIDRDHLVTALSLFDPVWEVLWPVEKARIIELVVERVVSQGEVGGIEIRLNPVGIQNLSTEAL